MAQPTSKKTQTDDDDVDVKPPVVEEKVVPPYGTLEWIQYLADIEGHLPTPINVSITGSIVYNCPDLRWYNFNVFPHKVKLTNTGYTLIISTKYRTERPYLEGGPFLEKHVLSQIHFHWGGNMLRGSEHTVDKRNYPAEMQVTYFSTKYLTQEEALQHSDGVTIVCYIIRYGVVPDERLEWVVEGFPRVRESQTHTRIGPLPMTKLLPMFYEDYFVYWGKLETVKGDSHVIKWIVPRTSLYASFDQLMEFRNVWNPWDEPNLGNFRSLQDVHDRHVLYISPHWCQYNSLLPIPRVPEPTISMLSTNYRRNSWMLPAQNRYEQMRHLAQSQSPITISSTRCPLWSSLEPLDYKGYWNEELKGILKNDGFTAFFQFDAGVRPTLSGGPLVGEYVFEQLHFHWSGDDYSGCEHLLDGQGYAAECHLVHYNGAYGSKQAAMQYPDGIAVVGFFLEAVDAPNPGFVKMAKGFEKIKASAHSILMTAESLAWMRNYDLREGNYIVYKGSLTTPPYTECVTWILYEIPVTIGHDQITYLRRLEGPDRAPIKRNVRPTQLHPPNESVIMVRPVKSKQRMEHHIS